MELLSAAASVIACYQLASEVGCQCLRYVRGVRQAQKDGDLVIAQIQTFQLSLHHLQGMLANEAANPNGGNRLKFLHEIMNGNSSSLMLCTRELEGIRAKLAKAQSGGSLREVFHKLSWPLKQEEVDRAITTLNSFAAAIDRGLAIDSNEVVRGIDSTTKTINDTTKQILISTESAKAQQEQREKLRKDEEKRQEAEKIRRDILEWLAHPDPSEIHNMASRARKSAKTGQWFLNGTLFQAFCETPRSVLWLHGDSGCGKSILCSAIIDKLRVLRSEKPSLRLAYWYFSVNDASRRSLQSLVRALFTQLCPTSTAPPALIGLWDANRKGREAPQTSESIQALVQMLGETLVDEVDADFFIVIDALDETNETERVDIIDLLHRVVSQNTDVRVHVLVTSRSSTVEVERRLQDAAKLFNVVMAHEQTDEDILTHITERLQNDEDLRKWSSDLRKEIEEALTKNAAGMFRWADCQLQAIRRCRKPKEVKKVLTLLPKDLRELYSRELANVEDSTVEDVRKLLGWLTYPQRPLRIEEAAEMLAVDLNSDPPSFDEDDRMPCPEDILKICGSLVRIDQNPEGRNSLGERARVQTLTAAHASVVDFLKEERVHIGRELEVPYNRAAMNLEMAETCLAYLLELVESEVVLRDENISNYPLARFSAELWDDFYREVVASSGESDVDMTRVNALVMRLFASRETILRWIQLCDPDKDTNRVRFDLTVSYVKPVMYYAALLGLPDIISSLIKDGHSVEEIVTEGCGTPLVAACVYGRANVASILLDNGADPNLPGNRDRGCPIAAAIEQNQTEIFGLLLNTMDVDVNARRFTSHSRSMVQKLGADMSTTMTNEVETGAESANSVDDADFSDFESGTELANSVDDADFFDFRLNAMNDESLVYIAARSGSLEMVNALLNAGADPNLEGGHERTAVQVACRGGSADIVETLLEHGANASSYGGESGSPLQAACDCPSLRTVKLLVGVPVDVNYVGDTNTSPLYLASTARDLEMVDLLIKHGASAAVYGGHYVSPLQVAAKYGDIVIVRSLLRAGSDVNRQGGEFGTALTAACRCGSTGVVKLLLDHNADPNIQGCWKCDNALQAACAIQNAENVLLLLESGADPNLHGGWYGSALHAAFSKGNEVIIRELLRRGADINYKGGQYHSVLQAAVASEKEEAVQIALKCGLSPNEKGGYFTYPLLRATALDSCPDSIVRILLKEGADPNLEREGDDFYDQTYRTALQHATSLSKAILLLDNGANVNTVTGWLGTALHTAIYDGRTHKKSLIKLLMDRGADVNQKAENIGSPLCYAAKQLDFFELNFGCAQLLIHAGAELNSVDVGGHSSIHWAITSKTGGELFDYVIGLGADLLLVDRRGCNLIHYAARANNLRALGKILECGLEVNSVDDFGWSPLHWAAASTRASTQVIKALLRKECNIDLKDRDGRTALDLALMFDNAESVAILNDTGMAHMDQLENGMTRDEKQLNRLCDGCGIIPNFCGSEEWYRCTDCYNAYDLCFRCIVDKDVLHTDGHSWSSGPSSKVESYIDA